MFDRYMIVENQVANVTANGQVTGFSFGARLPYYRGLGLSMVEVVQVSVDGEVVPPEKTRLSLRGRTWRLAELETEYEERWEMGEIATITVERPGGLGPGQHKVELLEQLRVSYLPFPLVGKDVKTIEIRPAP